MRRLLRPAPALALILASCVSPHRTPPVQPPAPLRHETPPLGRATPPPVSAPSLSLSPAGVPQQGALLRGRSTGLSSLTLDGQPVPIAADGAFLIGFPRDAGPQATLVARYADGSTQTRTITIAPRAWNIQSLPTLAKGTPRTPAEIARRQAEIAQIVAARAQVTGSEGWREPMIWPATGRISTHFGSQRIYAGEPGDPHSGTDIARPQGTPVAAPADGVVVLAADHLFSLEGNLLIVDHGMGLSSAFLHLSRIDVRVGDHVIKGQIVGAVGMTGRATGPHLHWALMLRGVRLDPELVAGPMPGAG